VAQRFSAAKEPPAGLLWRSALRCESAASVA